MERNPLRQGNIWNSRNYAVRESLGIFDSKTLQLPNHHRYYKPT